MKYIHKEFTGEPLFYGTIPYETTVNNGYTIRTQNYDLLEQLKKNEYEGKEIIDWYLFKKGKTVLIDNNGYEFGCTSISYGSSVQLDELIRGTYYRVKFKVKEFPDNVIPFEIPIRANSKIAAIGIAKEILNLDVYEILNAIQIL